MDLISQVEKTRDGEIMIAFMIWLLWHYMVLISLILILFVCYYYLIRIIYWNIHGAGKDRLHDRIKDFVKIHDLDLVFIFEHKISGKKAHKAFEKLGF